MRRYTYLLAIGGLCAAVAAQDGRPAPDKAKSDRNNEAIKKGVEFLKKNAFVDNGYGIGSAALAGLALLEAETPTNDPTIAAIAKGVRETALGEVKTYNLALDILFLDKLNDPRDVPLIQLLGARLIVGQNNFGGWSYVCGEVPQAAEQLRLAGALKPIGTGLHPEALKILRGGRRNQSEYMMSGGDDNSNTQFAIIGTWVAQRRGVPAAAAISAIDNRFLRTQSPVDHGWNYSTASSSGSNGSSTPAMTCAGLLGLAVGKANDEARKAGKKLVGEGNTEKPRKPKDDDAFFNPPGKEEKPKDEEQEPDEEMEEDAEAAKKKPPTVRDMAIERALLALGRVLGAKPAAGGAGMQAGHWGGTGDLYFIWSLERVAVAYGLETIGDVDWYDWGTKQLLPMQQNDGSWQGSHQATVETAFAVLFLKKSNFVADLTQNLNGKVKDPGNGELRGSRGGPVAIAAMGRKIDLSTEGPPDPKNPEAGRVRGPSEADRIANGLVARQPDSKWDAKLKAAREGKGGQWTAGLAQSIPFLGEKRSILAREALADRLTRMTPETLARLMKDRDAELRRAACLAAAMRDERGLTLDLIERVTDIDDIVVRAARASLKAMFNKDFGPPTGANDDRKRIALDEWKSWYTIDGPKK
jgi:hypothetical protein